MTAKKRVLPMTNKTKEDILHKKGSKIYSDLAKKAENRRKKANSPDDILFFDCCYITFSGLAEYWKMIGK